MAVLGSALLLLAVWCVVNLPRLASGQGGVIAFLLGAFFGSLLILRPKTPKDEQFGWSGRILGVTALVGVVAVVTGIVIPIHQFEWLGVLMVFYACAAWALPRRYGRDLLTALFIIYWIHPLPGQLFGPLQLGMQGLSVRLSEAVLQAFNVSVWGDGLVLRTGARVFGVPESCSGMKTAVTVLFCGLGIGLLMRFTWRVISGLLALGLVQVLVLNVIRISGIVWLGKDRPADWNEQALHDTMGIFLLLAVGFIHFDAVLVRQWLRTRKRKVALYEADDEVGEPEEKRKRWPTFWRLVFALWKPVLAVVLVGVVGAMAAVRLRPQHRAELMREVAEGMMVHDLPNAERVVRAALAMAPDHDGLKYDLALILLNRGQREEALELLRRKPVENRSLEERVLEARALLQLKRMDEMTQVITRFPPAARELPGVALVLAEFNAAIDRPAEVAANVVKASHGLGTQERIRRLFPYMASRDLWDSIRESDADTPYSTPLEGVIAAEAHLRGNDVNGAINVLRRAMAGHELDPIFLSPLIRVAKDRPRSEWVDQFERMFKANLSRLKATELAMAMEGGFAVGRPDLGWLAYRRLMAVSPDDPLLTIAPAEYGRKWFAFQCEALGMAKSGNETMVDAKAFLQTARTFSPWRELWGQIPLAGELGGVVTREGYQRQLRLCLDSLERMEQQKQLDFRLQVLYAQVLGEVGRWDEAHAKLKKYAAAAPHRRRDFLLAEAALYKAQNDPEMAYETLAEFIRFDSHPPLEVWLDQANAAVALGLGPYAMGILEEARQDFPESGEWALAMAGLWSYFGFAENALFLTEGLAVPPPPAVRVRLLMDTGRVVEGQRLATVEMLNDIAAPKQQATLLPPAEWTLEWRGGLLKDSDYAKEAAALPERRSPFLMAFNRVKADWYAAKGRNGTSDPGVWEGLGRDKREKALALNDLTMLLIRQGRTEEALVAARRALDLMPAWSLLWRMNVILRKDPAFVEEAYRACPRESELWLAHIVTGLQHGKNADWARREVERATTPRQYPAATLVRAGDFLIRQNMTNSACLAARAAIKDGRGLLPAYVLGLQCGIKVKDFAWAETCARDGAEQAIEPWPFFKIIVGLKAGARTVDPDVIRALESLAGRYPAENVWKERLGEAYFRQGQTDRAMGILEDAIAREEGKKQASVQVYLLAAESARREGNYEKAVAILRAARQRYPDDSNVLNNLAYTLAQVPSMAAQAVALLPDLLRGGRDDFAVYDTAALVYLRAGDLKAAEASMKKALSRVKKGDYGWIEVYLNAAETQIRMGKLKEAKESLGLVMKTRERTSAMDARAKELQDELVRREREQQGWF